MPILQPYLRPVARAPVADKTEKVGGGYGPELIPAGAWSLAGTGLVSNADGSITATGASNAATAGKSIALKDNTTYRVAYAISGYSGGGVKTQTYGATTAHLGVGLTRSANGSYVETVTTNAAGSLANQFRFQTTGAAGSNGYTISNISLREQLF